MSCELTHPGEFGQVNLFKNSRRFDQRVILPTSAGLFWRAPELWK